MRTAIDHRTTKEAVPALAAAHGLADLYRARFLWVARLCSYYAMGYPSIVYQEAVYAQYNMIPLLEAAIDHKLTRQLPQHAESLHASGL